MGLISKTAYIPVNGTMVKYYEDKGYSVPHRINKRGKCVVVPNPMITVFVSDLPHCSNARVEIECDNCGEHHMAEYRHYIRHNRNGKTYCAKCALKLFNSGESNHEWNPNKTHEERMIERSYPEYKAFIKRVMARDKYICQVCGQKSGDLVVHHLDGYNWCKGKRTDDANAIVLCKTCHDSFHNAFGRRHNTRADFEVWLGHPVGVLGVYTEKIPEPRKVYCLDDNIQFDNTVAAAEYCGGKSYAVYGNCQRVNKSVKGKHFLWLDDYESMNQSDIDGYYKWANRICRNCSGDCEYVKFCKRQEVL